MLLSHLAECSHFSREEDGGHKVRHRLHAEIHRKNQDAAKYLQVPKLNRKYMNAAKYHAAPVHNQHMLLQVPVLEVGGKEQGGGKDGKAADRGDGGGDIEVPSLEPDQ